MTGEHTAPPVSAGTSDTFVQEAGTYLLLSFAPSSGIGFYSYDGVFYSFDLLRDQDDQDTPLPDGFASTAIRHEFDQIPVMEEFSARDDLLVRARKEYLRDKKNTFYGILLNGPLDAMLEERTLELLGAPELAEIPVSEGLPHVLAETALPERVATTISRAVSARNDNVLRCLAEELAEVTEPFAAQLFLGLCECTPEEYAKYVPQFLEIEERHPDYFSMFHVMRGFARIVPLEMILDNLKHLKPRWKRERFLDLLCMDDWSPHREYRWKFIEIDDAAYQSELDAEADVGVNSIKKELKKELAALALAGVYSGGSTTPAESRTSWLDEDECR